MCGRQVTKSDSIILPVQWLLNQKTGATILTSISRDTTELRAIFGADYNRILGALKARLGSSSSAAAPAASSSSRAGPSSAVRSDVEPPRKRKKTAYDENDVIDLT